MTMNEYELKAKACTTPKEAKALYMSAPSGSAAERTYKARLVELEREEDNAKTTRK